TLVAQALDLSSGEVLEVETALNPQTAWGADVMTRVQHALAGGAVQLTSAIRETLGAMVGRGFGPAGLPPGAPGGSPAAGPKPRPTTVLLAGNTVMHHLFCGIDVAPLAHAPFHAEEDGERVFTPKQLGWGLPGQAEIHFLPCLGGFVGSDILAGILATGMAETAELTALIDLGTNGEIALGNRERILCASTAAGPAFEAGRIRMGMRAASGAISHVAARNGLLECRVIGGAAPRGICGSGLVDAAAAGLDLGRILSNGRLAGGAREMTLAPPVAITQNDIRELQLAKGAIAAGLRILAERFGARLGDIRRVHLAGAFGNYVNIESARRIGLLEVEAVHPAGNTSLRGVKMALLAPSRREQRIAGIRARAEHVPLAADPKFQETFVDCLAFP
ncbi:MAG: ASKHA domain-containing protein, partial [Acidobacteriia bacterium]|nr:ASKHA domain-containing protein [Terriglobia bacterium]